jgi:ABC-type phosphate transport system substrate-binding protein
MNAVPDQRWEKYVFKFRRLRRGVLAGATVVGAAIIGLAVAGPAGATATTAANNTIIGSGGNTPYAVLAQLATLFNGSEGCNLIVPSADTQPLNFSCPSGSGLPAGNPPFGYGSPTPGSPYSENPFNDVVELEPGIGSSPGISQLEDQSSAQSSTTTAPINFASSARGPNLGPTKFDDQGLNFVAYAADGVDYVDYTKVAGKATPAASIKSLSQAQLEAIWSGADKCWSDVGASGDNQLIDPYSTVTSSAITSTWDAFLGGTGATETYVDSQTKWPPSPLPKCKNGKTAVYSGPKFTNYAASHTIVQNELSSITHNGDQAYAITFFSYGRYEQQKSSSSAAGSALGSPEGVAPSEKTILDGSYPVPEDLYTVYSDGSNSKIPVSTPATLNFASEAGFLCKPTTTNGATTGSAIVDPVTGKTFRSEIEAAITSQGFFPLDGLTKKTADEGNVTTPVNSISSWTGSEYYPYDKVPTSGGQEVGYCKVFTTDGNTGHS